MLLVPFFCLPEYQHKIWSRNHLPTMRQRPIGFQICCVRRLSHQQLSPIRLLKGEKQVPTYYLFESPYKIPAIHLFLRFTTILHETKQRGEESWPFKRQTLHLGVYIFFLHIQMTKSWKPLSLDLHAILKYRIAGWGFVSPLACLCSSCSQPESANLSFSVHHILWGLAPAPSPQWSFPRSSQLPLTAAFFVLPANIWGSAHFPLSCGMVCWMCFPFITT